MKNADVNIAMRIMKVISVTVAVAFATFLTLTSVPTLYGQQVGEIKHTVLSKDNLSIPGREGVVVMAELAPGAREGRHTHPGDLFLYVREGTLTLHQEGKPTVTVTPGEVFFLPAGEVHWAENTGTTPLTVVATFCDVENGKPLTSPVK